MIFINSPFDAWAIIKSVLNLFLRYDVGHFPDLGIVFSVLGPMLVKKFIKCVRYLFRIINQFTICYNFGCIHQVGLFCINSPRARSYVKMCNRNVLIMVVVLPSNFSSAREGKAGMITCLENS